MSDVVVLPSISSEGPPIVVLEALVLGKPVVAARVGGIPEIIEDGETGLLVPPRNPQALAEAICALLWRTPPGRREHGGPVRRA